jgi:hypothetical protein
MSLRENILKLASEHPELRKHLVPILRQAGSEFTLYQEYMKLRDAAGQRWRDSPEDSPEHEEAWKEYSRLTGFRMNRLQAEDTSEKTFLALENLYNKEATSASKLHSWASRIKDPNTAVSLAYTGWKLAHGKFSASDNPVFASNWKWAKAKIQTFGGLVEEACTARFWEILGVNPRVKPAPPVIQEEKKWAPPAVPSNLIPQDTMSWQIYDSPGAGRVAKALATATATILTMAGRNVTPANTDAKNEALVRKLRARMQKVLNTYAKWGAADGEPETVMLAALRKYVKSYLNEYKFPKTINALDYWS